MKAVFINILAAGLFLLFFNNQIKAQCNTDVNADPVPQGTYYGPPGAVLNSTGKVHAGSGGPVVFRSKTAISLLPGFNAKASAGVTFTAELLPLKLNFVTFEDNDYPDVEPQTNSYNFSNPVASPVLTAGMGYVPSDANRYFISIFGPRYKDNVPNGSLNFDFHQGSDIVNGDVPSTSQDSITCRCDGVVVQVDNVDGGAGDPEGKWVEVRCNETFSGNPNWGNVHMAYRHLAEIGGPASGGIWEEGNPISKGSVIGLMGETGTTTNIHLHYSVMRKYCGASNDSYDRGALYNVHPMRTFNPAAYPHLLDTLHGAELFLLGYNGNSALLRLAVPYNQVNLRAIDVSLPNGTYRRHYDFEKVSKESDGEAEIRDQVEFTDGLRLYPYPFNRGKSAYDRYISKTYPAEYPGSTQRGYAIPNEGIFTTPAYVLDIEVLDLPPSYCLEDLQVSVIDIWGNGMKTAGDLAPQVNLFFDPADPTAIATRYVADNDLFFKTGETVEMTASAFDFDGSVSQVELFINGTPVWVDVSAPYNFDLAASAPAFNVGSWNYVIAVATDNSSNISRSDTLRVYVTANNLLTRRLTQNAADAEERKDNGVVNSTGSFDLDLCYDASSIKQYTGLWFNNVGIGKNAVIEKAYLQFAAKAAGCGTFDIKIYGEAADNPAVFTNSNNNISNRTATAANVTWSPDCWKAGVTAIDERTADLKSIVQETVNRSGWASGNSMIFILENDNDTIRRQAYSFHGCNPLERKLTRLIVEYSPAPASLPLLVAEGNETGGEEALHFKNKNPESVDLRIYPNPNTTGELTVEISGLPDRFEHASLMVSSLVGQTLIERQIGQGEPERFNLRLADLAPGTYLIRLNLDGVLITRRLVRF